MGYYDGEGIFFIGQREPDASLTVATAGGKAAGLACLDRLGFAVPPALALGADLCRDYLRNGTLDPSFRPHLEAALHRLEDVTGVALGPEGSLLLAVRSSPAVSMPGMLSTIANVGLSEANVHALIRRTGDPWLAWDAYRRLVRAFGQQAGAASHVIFDELEATHLTQAHAQSLDELHALALRDLAQQAEVRLEKITGQGLPHDPVAQVLTAIEAVLASWDSPRARHYRRINGIDDRTGLSVLVQTMVFGTSAGRSGSGVAFTRDPATGDDALYADFMFNGQGDDVVSGHRRVPGTAPLQVLLPDVWSELEHAKQRLERELGDMQDLEFTVEDGRLYFLQVRAGQRTPWAALRIAIDLVDAAILDPATAMERLAGYDLDQIARTRLQPQGGVDAIGTGIPAGPGVATGLMVLNADRARRLAATSAVILVRSDLTTEDLAGMAVAEGTASVLGGRTCHAAVVARQLGKACLVGCTDMRIDEAARSCIIGSRTLREGDVMTIDGDNGCIYAGPVPVVTERPCGAITRIQAWHDAARRSGRRSNRGSAPPPARAQRSPVRDIANADPGPRGNHPHEQHRRARNT